MHTDIENVEHIQSVLRKKGLDFDTNAIRKGLIHVRTVTDIEVQNFELPKNLMSNPKYKKFPL